jgi:hypothetical protein
MNTPTVKFTTSGSSNTRELPDNSKTMEYLYKLSHAGTVTVTFPAGHWQEIECGKVIKRGHNRSTEAQIPIDDTTYYFADQVVNPSDYIPTGQFNPHNKRPFLIGNEFGVLGIVYADHLQDALDEMVDADKLDSCLIAKDDYAGTHNINIAYARACKGNCSDCGASPDRCFEAPCEHGDFARLGNAGEPFDLSYIWTRELPNKQYAKIKTHYIAMSGDHGCIPDYCSVHPDIDSAVSDLVDMFSLGRTRKARLKTERTIELVPGIGEDDFGAQYCEVTTCHCDNPACHDENGIDLDDYLEVEK